MNINNQNLVFGLLNSEGSIDNAAVAAKYRDLTVTWSRYDFRGLIIEGDSVNEILGQAALLGYEYCLIQSYGHVLRECWVAEDEQRQGLITRLGDRVADEKFLVAGFITTEPGQWYGIDDKCMLVDLEQYQRLGRPDFEPGCDAMLSLPRATPTVRQGQITDLAPAGGTEYKMPTCPGWGFVEASLKNDMPVLGVDKKLAAHSLALETEEPDRVEAFSRYLGDGIAALGEGGDASMGDNQNHFLQEIKTQVSVHDKGMFLWNIEPYLDVESPPDGLAGPLGSLYSVAAGFKPNRMLLTHGCDENTRVVFFDYSTKALAIRREMVEGWDGEDYPSFVRYLLEKYPYPGTFYQLWTDISPDEWDWANIERLWQDELALWGGAEAFKEHWQACRKLKYEYVHCNILSDPSPLCESILPEPNAAIWFSNAFFTVYSNWYHTVEQRKAMYEDWAERLAEANGDMILYGSDYSNVNVNCIRAADYLERYRSAGSSPLQPHQLCEHEIRM